MNNLYKLLTENVNGGTFISIDSVTIPKLSGGKKNPHQGKVLKHNIGSNVMVFQNKTTNAYENMVKRRLEKEGKNPESFKLKDRTWGKRIPNTCFIEHKGEYYIEVIFLKSGNQYYTLDGVEVNPFDVNVYFSNHKPSQGGLDDTVIIRTYKVSSITKITINKQTYTDLTFNMFDEVA